MAESYIKKIVAGGIEINEAFKSFTVRSGETITAGTFVDFLYGSVSFPAGGVTINSVQYSQVNVTALDSSRILVAYHNVNGDNAFLRIGTISGNSITWQSAASLSFPSGSQFQGPTKSYLLEPNRLLLFTGSGSRGQAQIIRTDGTGGSGIITSGFTQFSEIDYTQMYEIGVVNANQVVVIYYGQSSNRMYTRIINFSGYSVTILGRDSWATGYFQLGDLKLLAPNKFLFNLKGTISPFSFFARIVNVSGNSATVTSSFNIDSIGAGDHCVFSVLSSDKVLVAYQTGSSLSPPSAGRARIMNITGNTITFGASIFTFLSTQIRSIKVVPLDASSALIAYLETGASWSSRVVKANISGDNISFEGAVTHISGLTSQFATPAHSLIKLGADKIVITYSSAALTDKTQAVVGNVPLLVANTTAEKVSGLAKTGGTSGQTIEVYTNA
jgi:hypothetical protein